MITLKKLEINFQWMDEQKNFKNLQTYNSMVESMTKLLRS